MGGRIHNEGGRAERCGREHIREGRPTAEDRVDGAQGAVSKPPDWSDGPAGKGDRRQRPPALPHQKRRQATAAPAADGIYLRPPPCPARKGDRRQRLPRPMSPAFTINTFGGFSSLVFLLV